jgi:hypothetical protein
VVQKKCVESLCSLCPLWLTKIIRFNPVILSKNSVPFFLSPFYCSPFYSLAALPRPLWQNIIDKLLIFWYNAPRIMNTTMINNTMTTTNNSPRPKLTPPAKTNKLRLISTIYCLLPKPTLDKSQVVVLKNKPILAKEGQKLNSFLLTTNTQRLTTRKAKNKPDTNPIQTHSNPFAKGKKPKITKQKTSSLIHLTAD